MTLAPRRKVEILMVEDNPDDIELTKEALADSKLANNLHVARTAEEALAYLVPEGEAQGPRPDLMLLDINLPGMSGLDLLEEIKTHDELTDIPIVILTTSSDQEDVLRSYKLHASCYVTKPVDFGQFVQVVQAIEGFWFEIVTLPEALQGGGSP